MDPSKLDDLHRRLTGCAAKFGDANPDERAAALEAYLRLCSGAGIAANQCRITVDLNGQGSDDLLRSLERRTQRIEELQARVKMPSSIRIHALEEQIRVLETKLQATDRIAEKLVEAQHVNRELLKEKTKLERQLAKGQSKSVPKASLPYEWTAEVYQIVLAMFIEQQATWLDVKAATNLSEGQIKGKFKNQKPDETLLAHPIEVRTDGPMDIYELWKIGSELCGVGWRAKIEARFDLKQGIHWNPPDDILSAEQIKVLREEWRRRQGKKVKKSTHETKSIRGHYRLNHHSQRLLDALRRAGLQGMTGDELKLVYKGAGFRRDELVRQRLVFNSGLKRNGQSVWVTADYRDSFPDAWAESSIALDQAANPMSV